MCGGFWNNPVKSISDTVSHVGQVISESPIAQAAITVGGAMVGVPPAVTAGVLGANQASQTGNLAQGLVTGGLSYLGGTGANNLATTGNIFGAGGLTGATAGSSIPGIKAGEAAYTLTGDAIADAAVLKEMGYGGSQIGSILGGGALGGLVSGASNVLGTVGNLVNGASGLLGGGTTAGGSGAAVNAGLLTSGLQTGMQLAGSYLNQQAAADAATKQADAQIKAAQIAADAAKFRPVGVTTNFGSSNFGYDANGNLTSAGYTLNPQLQAQQNQLMGATGGLLNQFTNAQQATAPMGQAAQTAMSAGLNQMNLGNTAMQNAQQWSPNIAQVKDVTAPMGQAAQNAMTLGNRYLTTDPLAQAQKYMADQQAVLSASRAGQLAQIRSNLAATGRAGLSMGGDAGMLQANPEMAAYYNALTQQDRELAAAATQGGMNYAQFGSDMVGKGGNLLSGMYDVQADSYNPFNTAMQSGQNQFTYGTGAVGTGGNLLSSMYQTQVGAASPYSTALGLANTIEGYGQQALDLGTSMGAKTSTASANAGQLLGQGMTNAAQTMYPVNANSTWGNLLTGGANALQNYKFGA